MVTVEFVDSPTMEDIQTAIERLQQTGTFARGITGGRALELEAETETVKIHFEQLSRIMLEHRIFEDAEGFSSTEMQVLRVIENGPEIMSLRSVLESVNKIRQENGQDPIEKQTLHHYLHNLRDKNLVIHPDRNQYSYGGP